MIITMKRFIIITCLLLSGNFVFAKIDSPENYAAGILDKMQSHRQSIYENLDLTPAQTEEIAKLDKKIYARIEPDLKQTAILVKKIEDIAESENCTIKAVNKVKKEFKPVQKNLNSVKRDYDREFKKILTDEQRTKYKLVREEKRKELQKEIHSISKH